MKIDGSLTKTQTVKGSIQKEELLALVRETLHIPNGANARFYVAAPSSYLHAQGGAPVSALVDIDASRPLQFMIEWSVPVGKDEQG